MRVGVGDDLEAGTFKRSDGIRRRRLDPVDLTRTQRGNARIRLRQRHQHELVELRHPRLVPIFFIGNHLGALTRNEQRELPRPGARRCLGEGIPALADLLPLRRRRHHDPGDLVGERRVRRLGGDLQRVLVDRLEARDRRDARAPLRRLARIVLRRLVVQDLFQIPHRRLGGEIAAVVEFHALAQLERPLGLVGLVDRPRRREAGNEVGGLGGRAQVPVDETVIDRIAGEPHALATVVGLAGGERNVRRGHADAQGALGVSRTGGQRGNREERDGSAFENLHGVALMKREGSIAKRAARAARSWDLEITRPRWW